MNTVNRDISSQDIMAENVHLEMILEKKEHLQTVVQLTWTFELPKKNTKYQRFMDSSERHKYRLKV